MNFLYACLREKIGYLYSKNKNLKIVKKFNEDLEKEMNNIMMMKDDISVIIGVMDKHADYLLNSLKTLRNQSYPQDLINIIIVDYSSKGEFQKEYRDLCKDYDCEYLNVPNKKVWNRSHCLNIGIRKSNTKYILSSDADMIFEKNYIAEVIKRLKKDMLDIVWCTMTDAPKGALLGRDPVKDYKNIKESSTPRGVLYGNSKFDYGVSVNAGLSFIYKYIGGYDEKYLVWGKEDEDMIKRLKMLGLRITNISSDTSHIHQWHLKYNNLRNHYSFERQLERNKFYYRTRFSIIRNGDSWGQLKKSRFFGILCI